MSKQKPKKESEAKIAEKALNKAVKAVQNSGIQDFTDYLRSPWKIFWANFTAGTARGLGFFVGAAIVLSLMGLIVGKVLAGIPIVGDFFTALLNFVQENTYLPS